ncbi:MAG: response regulator [Oscillospiraceae bacterium]|nr:response regulator [Oscillospiraceae bacterium]
MNCKLNVAIVASLAVFVVVTLFSITLIVLNYYGKFDKAPTLEIRPVNAYTETLHVATDWDYKPFSYVENGEYMGLDVEMIAEVANRLEMNLDLTLLDWNEAQRGLINGTYDLILNMESNAVLKDDRMIGTIPTDEKQYVVYGKNRIERVGELYGTRLAAYNTFDELGMDVITGYSYQEMFEKLLNDELDYIICPIQVGDSFIEKLDAQHVIVSSYQVSYMYGCMALKATDSALCTRLNEVIRDLQMEGFVEKLDAKWVTRRYSSISVKDILDNNPSIVVLLVVVIQLLVIGGIVIAFSTYSSNKYKAYSAELQKNLAIINQQNEELKIAEEKAQAASIAKTNFLFNMSHDIRTPMNAIIGFTDLACRHIGDAAKTREYLSKISTSSRLLLGLINDILEMARIENGKAQLNPTPENLAEIMEQAESMVRVQASSKNQELRFQTHITHQYVLCDRLKVNQILMNLVSNAVKYTNENGHILVRLEETASADAGHAAYLIQVKDDGIGMSEEFQKRIFQPFEREKSSTVSRTTGTGLGMAITKNLVDLMNGTISLRSELGTGSEFTVALTFPLAEAPVQAETAERAPETSAPDDRRYRILVVDDNDINRIIATELLNDMGYETAEACDGQEAIDLIQAAGAGDYDLILMDIQMPVVNGYEASKAIRALNAPLSSIPIIALTANAFADDVRNAEQAGMNGHVAKPIDVSALENTMKAFLSQKDRQVRAEDAQGRTGTPNETEV